MLHSQPTYERVLSQRAPGSQDSPIPSSLRDTSFAVAIGTQQGIDAAPADRSEDEVGSQPMLKEVSSDTVTLPRLTSHEHPQGLTPAVHSVDRVQLNSSGPGSMFPIFRSVKQCKFVYIVRHGESEYNAAVAAPRSSWTDPTIYDARLTMRGRQQAVALRKQLTEWNLPQDAVWVTSPLSRAIETMLHMHPGVTFNGDPCAYHNVFATGLGNVVVLPEISEKLTTSGDIGRRPSELVQRFPVLEKQLAQLPDVWWYNGESEEKLNCPYAGRFDQSEPKAHMEARIKAFRQWIIKRPEKVFVAVGHSVFWKAFATSCHNGAKQEYLKNCGWQMLHV